MAKTTTSVSLFSTAIRRYLSAVLSRLLRCGFMPCRRGRT